MTRFILLTAMLLCALPCTGQTQNSRRSEAKPKADLANFKYGPDTRNVLDLWKAKSDKPTPLVVFIHGGGFRAGDKAQVDAKLIEQCLAAGISVGAINYRLSDTATFPAQMLDGARAIQTFRHNAKEWNLDPKRIACTGGSAGAGISLWLGFHDDLADPKSSDPVARQSTRLTCMAVKGAQSSYDPRFIKSVIGGRAHEHPALGSFYGLKPEEFDSPKAHKLYEEASPINYLSADDPPVFAFYTEPDEDLPANASPGKGIHHPRFGHALKKKMDALKIECTVRQAKEYRGKRETFDDDTVAFFKKHFGM
jgi:acetyl esterase